MGQRRIATKRRHLNAGSARGKPAGHSDLSKPNALSLGIAASGAAHPLSRATQKPTRPLHMFARSSDLARLQPPFHHHHGRQSAIIIAILQTLAPPAWPTVTSLAAIALRPASAILLALQMPLCAQTQVVCLKSV